MVTPKVTRYETIARGKNSSLSKFEFTGHATHGMKGRDDGATRATAGVRTKLRSTGILQYEDFGCALIRNGKVIG